MFTAMPNGLASAPRVFTKLLKPVYSTLRQKGHESVGYIDDSCLAGSTYSDTESNIIDSLQLFEALGFTIHPEKSVLVTTNILIFLGFLLNSLEMVVTLTPEKASSLIKQCTCILKQENPTIRDVAKMVGKMNSSSAGMLFANLHYRQVENEKKTAALKRSRGDFDAEMQLSDIAKQDVQWFIQNAATANNPVHHGRVTLEIRSDASKQGFGGVLIDTTHKDVGGPIINRTQGEWTSEEAKSPVNVLELQGAYLSIKAFCGLMTNKHIRLLMDSTTAVCYLKKQGGTKSLPCNDVTRKIWVFVRLEIYG